MKSDCEGAQPETPSSRDPLWNVQLRTASLLKQHHPEAPPSLEQVARLGLSAGRLLLESGASGRVVHEAIQDIAYACGCDSAEVMCQHAGVLVMIRRLSDSCMQMTKVGEHGVNLRRAQAVRHIIRDLVAGELNCHYAQVEIDHVPLNTPCYPDWLICVSTGLACGAFGRLLGADWAAFLPIVFGSAWGQWIRMLLLHQRHNVFITAGVVSFLAAFMAGVGARVFGSSHVAVATVAAVLMLVPGVAVVNAQTDVLEHRPNLAMARSVRVLYLLIFMALGLALAQAFIVVKP
jgi:uncharacterized membrane protein YjjP (DUF1212 family)